MIFILGLPRSRTKWLSEFLKTDKCKTSHEEGMRHESLDSLYQSGFDVVCDTGLVLLWEEIQGLIVLIDRPLEDVTKEVEQLGLPTDGLPRLRAAFDEAKKHCLCIPYEDLKKERVCELLFEAVTGEEFDRERWIVMDKTDIVCDIDAIKQEVSANSQKIERLLNGKFS